jgi:hypothetical protein
MPGDDIINLAEMKGRLETELQDVSALEALARLKQAPADLDHAQ